MSDVSGLLYSTDCCIFPLPLSPTCNTFVMVSSPSTLPVSYLSRVRLPFSYHPPLCGSHLFFGLQTLSEHLLNKLGRPMKKNTVAGMPESTVRKADGPKVVRQPPSSPLYNCHSLDPFGGIGVQSSLMVNEGR